MNVRDLEAKCRAKIFKCKGLMTSPHLNEVCANEMLILRLIEERRLLARLASEHQSMTDEEWSKAAHVMDRVLQEAAECKS